MLTLKWQFYKEKNDKAHAEREERKANRGRWQGGGFGIKGALKGAATAGVLNGATGMLYSIGNSIGNAHSDSIMQEEMDALFSDKSLPENLGVQLFADIVRLSDILSYILNKNGMAVKIYSTDETCKCNNILKNYSKIVEKEEKKAALMQCFKLYPYEEKIYRLYINDFYRMRSEESEFERMCNFFGQDIEELSENVICETLEEIHFEADEEEKIRLIQLYQKQKGMFGLTERRDLHEAEQEYIDVRDIVVGGELSEIATLYQKEGTILKKRLEEGEILVSGNCEKAILYLKQQKKIRKIYETCDFLDRNSILEALNQIENEASKNEYQHMGKELVAYLQMCAELQNGVFDFYIEHNNLESNIKNCRPGRFVIQKDIVKLDGAERQEYFTRIYYCTNQEEKERIQRSILDIKQRYEETNFGNEASVQELFICVQAIYQKTHLGHELVKELEERLCYYDKCARTVMDIEYATREEAEKEREKIAGTRKYESIEAAQIARQEIEVLETRFKEAESNGLIASLLCYKKMRTETLLSPSAKDYLSEIEGKIANSYRNLCVNVESYKKAKRGMAKWIPISVIATIILLGIFLLSGIIGKIICVIIDFACWGKVFENKEVVDLYGKNIVNEKMEIERIAVFQNNTICFIDSQYIGNRCTKCGYIMNMNMRFCPICGGANK